MSKSESVRAMSDEDFMAQLLGVKTADVQARDVDVERQLQDQLSSISLQRNVASQVPQDFRGIPDERILPGQRSR